MDTDLSLRSQVCFALYAASRAVTALYRPLLDQLGLTYPQYLVMLVLWEHGDTRVRDLGGALMLDSGTLSPLLKRLQAAGYVDRTRDPHDERVVMVSLTAAGTRLRRQATQVPVAVLDRINIDRSDLIRLRDELNALTDAIDTHQHPRGDTDEGPLHR